MQEWKARIAIRAGQHASQTEASEPALASDTLAAKLCYVCHTTLTSKGTRVLPALFPSNPNTPAAVPIPVWTSADITHMVRAATESGIDEEEPVVVSRRKMGEEELRAAIDDFILDD